MYTNIPSWTQQNSWPAIADEEAFTQLALQLFRDQYTRNELYQQFAKGLGKNPKNVQQLSELPFLPISFFKTHEVLDQAVSDELLFFESSGTTGSINSKHYVPDPSLYERSFNATFRQFYGNPEEYIFLCLLPSYLERNNASLVYMANSLIQQSGRKESGFFLNQTAQLAETLELLQTRGTQVLLLGVTFALLDFAAAYPMDLSGITVMETGGMKGRKEEWTRQQVHQFLKEKWNTTQVHSEYGMTELLSQAYAYKDGLFSCPNHMQVLVRDLNDPLEVLSQGTGLINIIDLANIHSCAFIATDDIGKRYSDGNFEVLGRADHSALRGCSLLAL